MKKLSLSLLALATLSLGVGVTSCNTLTTGSLNSKQVENIEVMTSISFLQSVTNQTSALKGLRAAKSSNVVVDETKLNEILPVLDTVMNNGITVKSSLELVDTIIEGTTFAIKETYTFKDHSLKDASYTLVYNKTLVKEEIENDEEKETVESLTGYVLLTEDIKYPFTSIATSEEDNKETEQERNFKININPTSYVLVEEEFENELNESETEFSYIYVNNGVKEIEYSISIENKESGLKEISYELDGIEYEMSKVTLNNEEVYKIEIENRNDDETVVYYKKEVIEDGQVIFTKVQ